MSRLEASESEPVRSTILYQIAPWQDAKPPPWPTWKIFLTATNLLVPILLVASFAGGSATLYGLGRGLLIGAPLELFFAYIYFRALSTEKDARDARSLGQRLDKPSPFRQELARIELIANGKRYGADFGIVTAVDGWVSFEGNRTRFSLPCSMLRRKLRKGRRPLELYTYDDELVIDVGGQQRIVRLKPLVSSNASGLAELMDRSQQDRPANRGLAVLPPFTGPDKRGRPAKLRLTVHPVVAIPVTILAVLGIVAGLWIVVVIGLIVLCAAVWALSLIMRPWDRGLREPDGVWEAEAGPEESALAQRLAKYGRWSFDQAAGTQREQQNESA